MYWKLESFIVQNNTGETSESLIPAKTGHSRLIKTAHMVLHRVFSFFRQKFLVQLKLTNLLIGRQQLEQVTMMERLVVRCVEGEEYMTISYSYNNKQSNMLRLQMEMAEKSLSRLATNIRKLEMTQKRISKRMKRDPTAMATSESVPLETADISCLLLIDGDPIGPGVPNKEAWVDGAILQLGVTNYLVCRNIPTITSIKLPNCALVGFPIHPQVEFEFAKPETCSYIWYRGEKQELSTGSLDSSQRNVGSNKSICISNQGSALTQSDSMETNATEPNAVQTPTIMINTGKNVVHVGGYERNWVEVSTERIYTPQVSEIGMVLRLVCVPRNAEQEGRPKEVQTPHEIRTAPSSFPFQKRHELTKDILIGDEFRLLSYNILADIYADSDFSRDVLYPYCPKEALEIDYREQLILKELTGTVVHQDEKVTCGYNADIMCLQEVGKKFFGSALVRSLKTTGLDGLLCCKNGNVPEGEALFYRTDKFRLVGTHNIVLSGELEKSTVHRGLLEVVACSKSMLKRFLGLATVAQVVVLECVENPSRLLCIANTHLYFHPRAAHIRLIQTAIIVQHLHNVCSLYHEKSSDSVRPVVILCGDLNSTPDSGVYDYLTKGSAAKNSVDWYSSGNQEFCGGMTLSHSLKLVDACKEPSYTNFVAGFRGKLDHVLVEAGKIEITRSIPLSTHEEVTRHVALPNPVFPSDHMALVCELRWKDAL